MDWAMGRTWLDGLRQYRLFGTALRKPTEPAGDRHTRFLKRWYWRTARTGRPRLAAITCFLRPSRPLLLRRCAVGEANYGVARGRMIARPLFVAIWSVRRIHDLAKPRAVRSSLAVDAADIGLRTDPGALSGELR